MAKIDVTKIEGYEDMSPEDKVKALEEFEYDDGQAKLARYKNAIDKATAESSAWKKKHNALLSEDEKKEAENAEKYANMEKELNDLKREKVVSDHTAKFIALGYDEALAGETANAMADGDIVTVFANQKKFLEAHDKQLKADVMKSTPTPPAGGASNVADYSKAINDAYVRGDMTTAAVLMRQQQEALNSH